MLSAHIFCSRRHLISLHSRARSLSLALTQPPTRPLRRPFGKRAIYDHFNLVATLPLPRALSLSLARSEQTLRGKRGTNSYQVRGGLLGERTNPECAAFSSKKYPSSSNAIQVFSFWILRRRITPGTDGRGVSGFIRVGAQASFIKVGTAFHCNTESEANEARRDLIYGASFLAML